MSNTRELLFQTHGNEKQKQVARLWADDVTEDILFGGSKACLAINTLILTELGYRAIQDINIGDKVLSWNEDLQVEEWKRVLKTHKYDTKGDTEFHKIITFKLTSGEIISLTPNHELYFKGDWIAAGEFAERVLEIHRGDRWNMSNIYPRESVEPETWTRKSDLFESYYDTGQLFKTQYNPQKGKDHVASPQISCFSFHPKSRREINGESHQLRQAGLQGGKFRVGDCKRKCTPFKGSCATAIRRQEGFKEQQDYTNGISSTGNQAQIQETSCDKGYVGCGVRGITSNGKGYSIAQELDAYLIDEIKFELLQGSVYDLTVEDNHNFIVSKDNLILHNSGKSFLGCVLIFGDALTYPETNYFISRKTGADLMKYTTGSVQEVFTMWGITDNMWKLNGQYKFYELYNGSKVYLLDAAYQPSDPTYARFGSIQMTRGWIEEAGEFSLEAKTSLQSTIGRWNNEKYGLKGKLLQTCNPSKNYLYPEYYLPKKNGILNPPDKDGIVVPRKAFVQAYPQDNKKIDKDYLDGLFRTLTGSARERLLYGNWEYDDDPTVLIEYDKIVAIFKNEHVSVGKKFITADIARLGGDKIVIISWNGMRGKVTSFSKKNLKYTLDEIEKIRKRDGIALKDVLVDADGIGSGIEDFGGYRGFMNNWRAKPDPDRPYVNGKLAQENYDNIKSQCGFRLAEYVNNNNLYLECSDAERELIIGELEQLKQKEVDTDNKKGLVKKEEVKKLIGRSPDFSDALIMRTYFDLIGKSMSIKYKSGNNIPTNLVVSPHELP